MGTIYVSAPTKQIRMADVVDYNRVCAEEICRSGSISKNHQLTSLNKCGKFHACILKSTILALSRLASSGKGYSVVLIIR